MSGKHAVKSSKKSLIIIICVVVLVVEETPSILMSLHTKVACNVLVSLDESANILNSSILNPNEESSSISVINSAILAYAPVTVKFKL